MKKIIILLVLLYGNLFCQILPSEYLENICLGSALAVNEVFETMPKNYVLHKNKFTGEITKVSVVLFNDNKQSYYTVLVIKINSDLAYILGYAPGISNKKFNGMGEVCVCKKEKGMPSKIIHVYKKYIEYSENNELMQKIVTDDVTVVIEDYFEVKSFSLDYLGRTVYYPDNYFEYK